MLSRSAGALRQIAPRLTHQASNLPRAFSTSIARKDPIQDMYLRELKNYKPTPVAANDHEGYVHKFKMPQAPASPAEEDLSTGLKEYETQEVEVDPMESEINKGYVSAFVEVEPDWTDGDEDQKKSYY